MVGQPELDAQGGRKIRRLAVALGWLEANLCGGLFRRLVEPVSQGFDHADDSYRAVGLEDHGKRDLTLNSQSACLIRVDRGRLGEYLDGLELRGRRRLKTFRWGLRDMACLLETTRRHSGTPGSATSAASSPARYPAAKTGAGDHSLNAMSSAGPVSDTGAFRKSKGSQLRDVAGTFTLRLARQSLRTPKPTRLHLFHRTFRGDRFRRTTKKTGAHWDLLFRGAGWVGQWVEPAMGGSGTRTGRGNRGPNLGNYEVGHEGCRSGSAGASSGFNFGTDTRATSGGGFKTGFSGGVSAGSQVTA